VHHARNCDIDGRQYDNELVMQWLGDHEGECSFWFGGRCDCGETCGEDRDHAENSRIDARESECCERDSIETGGRIGTGMTAEKLASCLPPRFENDGCIQDGAHRLHATAQSEKPLEFECDFGSSVDDHEELLFCRKLLRIWGLSGGGTTTHAPRAAVSDVRAYPAHENKGLR
jgi:hypothetical protein